MRHFKVEHIATCKIVANFGGSAPEFMKILKLILLVLFLSINVVAHNRLPQVGFASYYGDRANHHKTANGEHYCVDSFTAAHRTLPFGTILKVTNLKNHKYIFVRVNDRGPHRKGRIIDLSGIAANRLALVMCGTTRVKLERATRSDLIKNRINDSIGKDTIATQIARSTRSDSICLDQLFIIQAGTFKVPKNALHLKAYLNESRIDYIKIKRVKHRRRWYYKVLIGPLNVNEKENILKILTDKGINAKVFSL